MVTLFLLAVIFVSLDANVVAVLQIIVYAGAIMVLFLFVIMLLNLQEDRPAMARVGAARLRRRSWPRCSCSALCTFWCTRWERRRHGRQRCRRASARPSSWRRACSRDYLFAFELTSILLLVAIVGAVVLAKRKLA